MANFVDKYVLIYLDLVLRRLYILLHPGIGRKPGYGPELEVIDGQLVIYRYRVEEVCD